MLLTDLKQMEGKTVRKAKMGVCDDNVIVLFTDGSLISLESRQVYDTTEIVISDEVSNFDRQQIEKELSEESK